MNTLQLPAPAKLNLFLRVLNRQPSGYHNLQTVFQLIDLCDLLTFQATQDGLIQVNCPGIIETDNIVFKAAKHLQRYLSPNHSLGVSIAIDKRIPQGAGLGGGSSDAATTLLALNQLWGAKLSLPHLQDIGAEIGADVPVFINGRSAWAEGIGDQLTPIPLPNQWFLVVYPQCHSCTKRVFSAKELTRDQQPITLSAFQNGQAENDCTPVAVKQYPAIETALNWLKQFGEAKMSGTGSSCFVAFKDATNAQSAYNKLPLDWQGFITKSLDHSPLHKRLGLI